MKHYSIEEKFAWVCDMLAGVQPKGEYAMAYCPAHKNTDSQSLSVIKKADGVTFKCHGNDCPRPDICAAIGITESDLYLDNEFSNRRGEKVVRLKSIQGGKKDGCTVEDYAEAKDLPTDWLRERFGLRDKKKHRETKAPYIEIPYFDDSYAEVRTRERIGLDKANEGPDPRFRWKPRSKADRLYGLEDLPKYKANGRSVFIVEGESDRHTLVYHDVPALGVPGANNVKNATNVSDFEGIEDVYAVVEPDDAGQGFGEKLGEVFGERLKLVSLGEDVGDVSALHLASENAEEFRQKLQQAIFESVPYTDQQQAELEEEAEEAWESCKDLATAPDILARFERDVKKLGVVGQEKETKLIYLASISRHLNTPTSIVIKGPSSAGKSFMLNKVLEFVPEAAYYKLSAMSEKALAHFTQPLSHRHLVIAEAAALENSEFATYLLRTLLSEGYVRYTYPEVTPDGIMMREINVEGPTGLLTTTTAQALHNENETRYLSIGVNDTKYHTSAVMRNEARERRRKSRGEASQELDLSGWHALERWIALTGDKRVDVPYAEWIADQIPPVALRLRRDFSQLLNLIEAHAILHQASRMRNEYGAIIAIPEDYAVVRELVNDLMSENLEASVPAIVRETVVAMRELYDDLESKENGVPLRKITEALGVDKAAASRRVRSAVTRGFISNLEDRKGRPAKYVPGDPLPTDLVVLPDPAFIPSGAEGGNYVPNPGPPPPTSTPSTDQHFTKNEVSKSPSVREQEDEMQVEYDRMVAANLAADTDIENEADPDAPCIHEVPGGCWLCKKKKEEEEA